MGWFRLHFDLSPSLWARKSLGQTREGYSQGSRTKLFPLGRLNVDTLTPRLPLYAEDTGLLLTLRK